ncbi:Glycosyltransferase, GT2 family [Allochromatium warmingii]|uniref:Glycosyltransferase, GT2 family n=1 Tax=Allochromatium warmingii TaxID=61595 RepID=A0A1H3E1C4_ALLWA|nr:glycosyltransferase [Allochromatium warmingii]SDX72420.1 Glycosyltransferase, GT2 family [Allochromatium warmingii]
MPTLTDLALGNKALRNGNLQSALRHYLRSLDANPGLAAVVTPNIASIRRRNALQRRGKSQRYLQCLNGQEKLGSSQVSSRVAALEQAGHRVDIVTLVDEAGPQLKNQQGTLIHVNADTLAERALEIVLAQPVDQVDLWSADPSSLALGCCYAIIWGTAVYLWEEGSHPISDSGLPLGQYLDTPYNKPLLGYLLTQLPTALRVLAAQSTGLAAFRSSPRPYESHHLALSFADMQAHLSDGLETAGEVSDRLFALFIGRSPQQHERNHYRHLLTTDRVDKAGLSRMLWAAEEGLRHRAGFHADRCPRALALVPIGEVRPKDIHLPACESPELSILIPVYGQLDHTLACLYSVAAHPPRVPFEVVVLDDRSPDDSARQLQQIDNLRVIVHPQNLGFVRSCNRGAEIARGRYLFFLNNDTQIQPCCFDALFDTYQYFPKAGLIGAKLVYPDGRLQEAGGIVWQDASAWNYGRDDDPHKSVYNYVRETDYCSGAAILIEKALFEQLGRFDERYCPAYCEDTALAFTVRAAGKQVIYQPRAEVVHFEGISHGTSTDSGIKAYQVANNKRLFEQWQHRLSDEHFPNAQHVPLARERSARKCRVLIIDHYVPQPDRDAGSRTMFQLMEALLAQGVLIKFWPANNRYDPDYTPQLERRGIEVMYGKEFERQFDAWMREHGGYLSAVIASRPHITEPLLESLRSHTQAKILYYGHDLHHRRLQAELELHYDARVHEEMRWFEKQEKQIWTKVDAVYYPSADETNLVNCWLREQGLPESAKTLPPYAFEQFPANPEANLKQRRDIIFVGGFAHPPNVGGATWFVREVLPLVQHRFPDVHLTLIGSNPKPEVIALGGPAVTVTGFVPDEVLDHYYATARVAIAPLRYGAGIKGKVVESMRHGLPCVTTPAGVQGLDAALSCLSSESEPKAFAERVMELMVDDALWVDRSRAAQRFCRQQFTHDAMWQAIRDDIPAGPLGYQSTLQERAA